MQVEPKSHVFALPYKDGFLIYAPLVGRIVHANTECVAQVRSYLQTLDPSAVSPDVRSSLGGLDWLVADPPVPLPTDRQYHPSSVTLFLTNRCNLRCTYCYARAGESPAHDMSAAVYRAAIDLVVRNARRAGREVGVGFHGGGEPTVAWDSLTGAVEYAKRVAGPDCPGVHFGIATNGVMSRDHAEFLARTVSVVTLSFDGPSDIQNQQRPSVSGEGSFDAVMAFVEVLRQHGTTVVIRTTVTENNVERLPELVEFFADHTPCRQLHFEPAFLSGRCCHVPTAVPPTDAFAARFIAAFDRARERRIPLYFSAARLMGAFLSFCGCAQDAFNVTPEGDVTACYEVCSPADRMAGVFYFGRYVPESGRFVFDTGRVARLRALNVYNKPLCQGCFAKWNCAGDCPNKIQHTYSRVDGESPRCRMIQSITRAMLERALHRGSCKPN